MAIDYTIPTYSRPDLGWDVPAYIKKYYEDKKTKEDEKANAVITEGAGVRSDQIYDSADPATRTAVGWGGGAFTPTEMSTGEPNEVAPRYDQWGNEVDMGNRKWGIAFNKALPNIVNMIPGYNFVKAFNDAANKKTGQTTASTDSTGSMPKNILEVMNDTEDDDILTTASAPTTNYSWPVDEQQQIRQVWNAGTSNVNPLNASEIGLLDMLRQAAEQNAIDQENVAIDMNAPGIGNVPF